MLVNDTDDMADDFIASSTTRSTGFCDEVVKSLIMIVDKNMESLEWDINT